MKSTQILRTIISSINLLCIFANVDSFTATNNVNGTCKYIHYYPRKYECRDIIGFFPNQDYSYEVPLSCQDCLFKNFTYDTFPYTNKITELNISWSGVERLGSNAFKIFTNCKVIDLSYNRLTEISTEPYGSDRLPIDTLLISHNLIRQLSSGIFSMVPNLLTLSINNNFIRKLEYDTFADLKNLLYLELQNNEICALPLGIFRTLINLRELNLANNKLTTIHLGTFSGLKYLLELKLKGNNLKYFKGTEILPLHKIQTLDISNNKIVYLDPSNVYASAPTLRTIHLNGNFFSCSLLIEVVQLFKLKSVAIETENGQYDVQNIDGIPCSEDTKSDMSAKEFMDSVWKETKQISNKC